MTSEFRVLGSVILLFFLPGMSLVWALFPRREDLEIINRIGLSIGLSITITASISVLLNYSPWGIQGNSVSFSLFLFTVVVGLFAWLRSKRSSLGEMTPKAPRFVEIDKPKSILIHVSTTLLFLTILGALFLLGIGFAFDLEPEASFTEFYFFPAETLDGYYPDEILVNEPMTLRLGIANHEGDVVDYRIAYTAGDRSWERNVRLDSNSRWEGEFILVLDKPCDSCRLYFVLFKEDDVFSYHSLHMTVTVRSPIENDR